MRVHIDLVDSRPLSGNLFAVLAVVRTYGLDTIIY
jgi:hypothetical protein